jgi:hypothetical protein
MTTEDYTWDNSTDSRVIGKDAIPLRFALTAPVVVESANSDVLLIDPHPPGTWDTWMFPYASLVLTIDQIADRSLPPEHAIFRLSESTTLGELASALVQLRSALRDEYEAAISDGINSVLPDLKYSDWDSVVYENFSLKFSHTSGVYTAYLFQYIRQTGTPATDVPSKWISISLLSTLDGESIVDGRTISSNVLDAAAPLSEES